MHETRTQTARKVWVAPRPPYYARERGVQVTFLGGESALYADREFVCDLCDAVKEAPFWCHSKRPPFRWHRVRRAEFGSTDKRILHACPDCSGVS